MGDKALKTAQKTSNLDDYGQRWQANLDKIIV